MPDRRHPSLRRWIVPSLVALAVLIVCLPLFQALLQVAHDLGWHARMVLEIPEGFVPPANVLYYLALYVGSGFEPTPGRVALLTVGMMAAAVAARFLVSFGFLREAARGRPTPGMATAVALALALCVAFSLPTFSALQGRWYLGQTPPNVWHNSTQILLMPLAIGLYWASCRNLGAPSRRQDAWIALLVALNVLAKPSFFLAFAIAYPAMLVARHGLRGGGWLRLWPVALGVLLLAVQYALLYQLDQGNPRGLDSAVVLRPLEAWSRYSGNIPLSILVSTAFPVTYLLWYRGAAWQELPLRYALALYGVAVGIMALFAETGPRWYHGNFFWQAYASNFMLFLAAARGMALRLVAGNVGRRAKGVVLGMLALHVTSGIGYLVKVLASGSIR